MAEDEVLPLDEEDDAPVVNLVPDFRFTDQTINLADGEYAVCCQIMASEPKPWCLVSNVTLLHVFGMCEMRLEFMDDGRVTITTFSPSNPDPVSNYDLRCLNSFCGQNGWKKPTPSMALVRHRIDFWHHMWTVDMVESEYIESRYGKRELPQSPNDAPVKKRKPRAKKGK